MELLENDLNFEPALDFALPNSFLSLIDDIIQDILHQAQLIERIKPDSRKDYVVSSHFFLSSISTLVSSFQTPWI